MTFSVLFAKLNAELRILDNRYGNRRIFMKTKHIKTVKTRNLCESAKKGGCGECQTSCQSACKTSCGIANQKCEKSSN